MPGTAECFPRVLLQNVTRVSYKKYDVLFSAERAMDRAVARLNIEHYRRLLARETDETRRQTIMRLLAEEEAKLADPSSNSKKKREAR